MARLTDRDNITSIATNDLIHVVDISDKADSPEGTSKKATINKLPFQLLSGKGSANGYTPLNQYSKVDPAYLPSYVDDVLEFSSLSAFPSTGEHGKLYVALDSNLIYRWSGSTYVNIGGSGANLVDSVFGRTGGVTAKAGDYSAALITNNSSVSGDFIDDALNWLSSNRVPNSRTISSGTGLTGGGNLTQNRTISFDTSWGDDRYYTQGQADNNFVPNSRTISTGLHLSGGGNLTQNRTLTFTPNVGNWVMDSQGISRMYFGSETDDTNGIVLKASNPTQQLQYRNSDNNIVFRVFNSGFVSGNSGAGFSGNVTAQGFIGDGSQLTGVIKHNTSGVNTTTGGSLDAQEGQIYYHSNSNNNYGGSLPSAYGLLYQFQGSTTNRHFSIFHNNNSTDFYLGSWDTNNNPTWNQIWHDGNLRSNSQNDSRYFRSDVTDTKNGTANFNGEVNIRNVVRFTEDGIRGVNILTNTTDGASIGTYTSHDFSLKRGNSTKLTLTNSGVDINGGGDIRMYGGTFQRYTHNSGYLVGSYNSVGANPDKTNAIYTIGSAYTPTDTTLENMYGIGFSQGGSASFLNSTDLGRTPSNGWGMYVAAAGKATVFLDGSNGRGHFKGFVYSAGFFENSDERLKKNITPLENSLSKLESIGGYTYDWKEDSKSDMGVIAQEVEKVLPHAVSTDSEGMKSVNYSKLVPVLIEAIKELSNEVKILRDGKTA